MRRQFYSQRLGEALDTSVRGTVRRRVEEATLPGNGGDVDDDAALALLDQGWQHGLAHQKTTSEFDL